MRNVVPALCGLLLSASAAVAAPASRVILPPFPAMAGAASSNADEAVLAFDAPTEPGRVYWDFPMARGMTQGETSLELEAELSSPSPLTGVTLQLRCGGRWYTARIREPGTTRGRTSVPLARFRDEAGRACNPAEAELLRISVWVGGDTASGVLKLYGLRARRDVVAVAVTGDAGLLERCRTLFDVAGISYAEIGDDFSEARRFKLVAIPQLTDAVERRAAKTMLGAARDGTAFMIFYSASPRMSETLGIEPGSWSHAEPGSGWTAMIPDGSRLGGFSKGIPHETDNILPPFEGKGAQAVAWWADETGRRTRLPACVVSAKGVWFSHIPPLPSAPAAEFMRRLCLRFAPELADGFAVNALMRDAALIEAVPSPSGKLVEAIRTAVETRHQLEEVPRMCAELRDAAAGKAQRLHPCASNEIHAVWDPRAPTRSLARWRKMAAQLDELGVTAVFAFAQIGWAPCFARPGADAVSPALERYVAEASEASLEVHAWVRCLSLEGASKSMMDRLAAEKRLIVSAGGPAPPWLCPVNPENRRLLAGGAAELVRAGAAGVHLDYIRYPEAGGCFCEESRKAFENVARVKVAQWPADVMGEGALARSYRAFQTDNLTELVGDIARTVRGVHAEVSVSAAVYPEAASAAALCQDWPSWLLKGHVDFICPMSYHADEGKFAAQLGRILAACPGRERAVVPGIGTTANEPGPDAWGAARQILAGRRSGCGGFAFFYLDDMLIESILPPLTLDKRGRQSAAAFSTETFLND